MGKRLYRSQRDRVIAGVCGGLGEYFQIDPTIIRIIFVVLLVATGVFPVLLVYLVMAIIVPLEGRPSQEPRQTVADGVEDLKETVTELSKDIRDAVGTPPEPKPDREDIRRRRTYLIGLIVVIIGIIALVANLGGLFWWGWLWPVVLIALGLAILWGIFRRQ